jgi:CheY-like chemotaxis protein/HPt (histidine-containing phosphotransfer) domain-containing protein
VDDNAVNRRILQHQTTAWRMRQTCVANGEAALAALRAAAHERDPFGLAIVDLQMPGMDGLTLARQIKSEPLLAATRLVLLTSMGQPLDPTQAQACGVAAWLIKPIKHNDLLEALLRVVGEPEPAPAAPRPAVVPQPAAAPQPNPARPLRILVAEDNAVNRTVALRQLRKLGYSAEAVANGLEAVEAIEQFPYDVVLMDCQMPELDGYEATRRIRALEASGHWPRATRVRIVAMTANAMKGDREKCLAAGMDDYISKPVALAELQRVLEASTPASPTADPASVEAPVLNPTLVSELKSLGLPGEADPFVEVMQLFLQDTPERIQTVREALRANDTTQAAKVAHTLKGSCANVGAERMRRLSSCLERAASEGAVALAEEYLAQIERELAVVRAQVGTPSTEGG